ncbi:MAG: class I SAM-dependent methyltransferase [Ignavibacteria bacterium]|nr:class I SAM-dependent methyltransferase [Ignavibacteria bacterium]
MKNENFYNAVSPFYDSMISMEKSLIRRKTFYETIFANQNIKLVADLGCGSGLDSLALASMGLKVIGFDQSAEMIHSAKQNAAKFGADIQFIRKGISDIPQKFTGRFDAVVSFGNTLANLDETEARFALQKVHHLLKPNGLFLFQILNYARVEKKKETVIGFTESDDSLIIRFNEFLKDEMKFHFLSINKKTISSSNHYSTKIFPHKQKFISTALRQSGFSKTKLYGSLLLEKFNANNSKDLISFTQKLSVQ